MSETALEQVQICVGVPSHPIAHDQRHSSYILNTLLGGGMSSRLFVEVITDPEFALVIAM